MELILLQEGVQGYLLIFARVGSFMSVAPFWSGQTIPLRIRIFLCLIISMVLLPVVWEQNLIEIDSNFLIVFAYLAIRETLLGMLLGLVSSLLFYCVQVAGQVIDTQMGFGMVNVLDPQSGGQLPVIGNLFYLLAIILFLSVDGHHHLLYALNSSFAFLPLGTVDFPRIVWYEAGNLFGQIIAFALRVSLPVAGILFMTDMALGIIARTVPQMNVFVLGIPVKIIVGLLTLIIVLPLLAKLLQMLFAEIFTNLDRFLFLLSSGT